MNEELDGGVPRWPREPKNAPEGRLEERGEELDDGAESLSATAARGSPWGGCAQEELHTEEREERVLEITMKASNSERALAATLALVEWRCVRARSRG